MMNEKLPAEEVDRWPRSQAELGRRRALLRSQLAELGPAARELWLVCPCGKRIGIIAAFKCAECGVWLCEVCGRRHFKSPGRPTLCIPATAADEARIIGPAKGLAGAAPAWSMRPRHLAEPTITRGDFEMIYIFTRSPSSTGERISVYVRRRLFHWYDPRSWRRSWRMIERSEAERASDEIFDQVKHGKTSFADLAEFDEKRD